MNSRSLFQVTWPVDLPRFDWAFGHISWPVSDFAAAKSLDMLLLQCFLRGFWDPRHTAAVDRTSSPVHDPTSRIQFGVEATRADIR